MASARVFIYALSLLIATSVHASINGDLNSETLESVPDLEKAMYWNVESSPCVKLLNLTGAIGCSNPADGKITAPIFRLKSTADQLVKKSTVLLPLELMNDFFQRVSSDSAFVKNVAGVLVESSEIQNISSGFSPADKFPQAAFAPYNHTSYSWNPPGSGIMYNRYDFPVFLLSKESTATLQEIASGGNNIYPSNVAEFDLVMQTTKLGSHNSESCLKGQTCLPLGGYSVWSSLPPINISSKNAKPIVLVVASMDSASFFRDNNLGADSPISGLIALLTAVEALSHIDHLNKLEKQLVFAVFTGEAWGYLGSRKFLQELDSNSDYVSSLNSSMIEQVIEIGSVGKSLGEKETLFYAHTGAESSATKQILNALETSSESLGTDNVNVKKASSSNPGVPPSSLMAFLKKNASTAGVVLADFDSSFSNKFYHSHLDSASNINASSISAASVLLSRALYTLATGTQTLDLMTLNSIKTNTSLVDSLISCLLTCDPGLSCSLVKQYISPSDESADCPSHYVGVFLDLGSGKPGHVGDDSRFVWNFLGGLTGRKGGSCKGGCGEGEICVGGEVEGGGTCVVSTTRYVPAYSTRLKYENNIWNVLPEDSADPMGSVDPVWTESYWNTIGLRVYKVDSKSYDRAVLAGGIFVTFASYLAIVVSRTFLAKAVKLD
ncbi:hypothetical protein LUZ60_000246 [Juncus effusus]|nr:hypothetical protein LUZ60_000246 [Juncus effusus]